MTNNESREAFEAVVDRLEINYVNDGDYEALHKLYQARQPEIDALQARIAELEAQTQWQDISTAPKDERFILVTPAFGASKEPYQVCWFAGKRVQRWEYAGRAITANPTHWMPLPKPPTAQE